MTFRAEVLCLAFICHHLNHIGLLMAERHFVAHQFIDDGVLKRGVLQHLDLLALDEAHLDDAFAESSVTQHLHDDAFFACL